MLMLQIYLRAKSCNRVTTAASWLMRVIFSFLRNYSGCKDEGRAFQHIHTCRSRNCRSMTSQFTRVVDMPNRRRLRSASSKLDVPSFRLPTVGSHAFPIAGAKVWNSLPDDVTSAPFLSTFRHHLKTHLFRCCYNTLWFCSSAVLTLTIVVLVVALLLRPL